MNLKKSRFQPLSPENSGFESGQFQVVFLPVEQLKPHEKGSPLYLELLKKEILRDGVLKYPIIADDKTLVILDGMHRWLAIQSLGYEKIPVLLVNALENPKIRVGYRRVHRYVNGSNKHMTVEEVVTAALSGQLMPPRSTRHFFPFIKPPRIDCPLESLGKGAPKDVSKYLADMTPEECRKAIKSWLEEISEELEFLRKRIEEVEREREEFLARIKSLNAVNGFF
jgi:hypothetical protein